MRWPAAWVAVLLLACGADPEPGEPPLPVEDVPDVAVEKEVWVPPVPDTSFTPDDGPPGTQCKPFINWEYYLIFTVDTCTMPGEVCVWTVAEGFCLINHVCRKAGEIAPHNPCAACDPATPTQWSIRADGEQCADDVCLESFACQAGACVGDEKPCDDHNPCSVDSCNPAIGCVASPGPDGVPCTTDNPCVLDAQCLLGGCLGSPPDCDDGDGCTLDLCDPDSGCVHKLQDGLPCDDGDACTTADQCFGGKCLNGPMTKCDDDNPCSIDTCNALVGCVHLPTQSPCCTGLDSVCDDGNACTDDLCDPQTLDCASTQNTKNCDDGNSCTIQDLCDKGQCVGKTVPCDDGDPCTQDVCDSLLGCTATAISGVPCNDSIDCTTGDLCTSGKCVGDDSSCGCDPDLNTDPVKATTYLLGTSGSAGHGLNVDQDLDTCAPKGNCSGGIDNAFGVLGSLTNEALQGEVDDGDVMLIFDMPVDKSGTFTMALHQGQPDPADEDCNYMAETCDYWIEDGGLDPDTCKPKFKVPCTLTGNKLSCGGKGVTLPFELPVQDGVVLDLAIFDVRVEAQVTKAGPYVTGLTGAMGGAIRQDALLAAIDSLDEDGLPIPKDLLKSLLTSLLEYDIDTDGDGNKDAASIGFQLKFIDAVITGVDQ